MILPPFVITLKEAEASFLLHGQIGHKGIID